MTANFPIYLLVMAGVTYLIRMLPLTIFRKEIKSTFIKSFLHYVPFAVLGAMTIPDVLYSTGICARRRLVWWQRCSSRGKGRVC